MWIFRYARFLRGSIRKGLAKVGSCPDLAVLETGPGGSTRCDVLCAVCCGIHTAANLLDGRLPLARHPEGIHHRQGALTTYPRR